MRARRWKKANIHKRCPKFHFALTVISLESVRNAFSADVCEWFLALDWIIHQRVSWEQNIRYIYFPSLQLSIIMWLSHLLTSFSSQRNRYLFPKYRVTHIWAERFRYGYTPCISKSEYPRVLQHEKRNDPRKELTCI